MERAATVLTWMLFGAALAIVIYTLETNPGETRNYLAAMAVTLTGAATLPMLTIARYTLADPGRRGRMPLREATIPLLAGAAYCLLPDSTTAICICASLVALAGGLTVVSIFRKKQPGD